MIKIRLQRGHVQFAFTQSRNGMDGGGGTCHSCIVGYIMGQRGMAYVETIGG